MSTPTFAGHAPDRAQRVEYLDSIRGLAALVVLLGHCAGTFAWPESTLHWMRWPLLNALVDGRSAVTMFFVLSGYVLALPYLIPAAPGATARRLFWPTFYLRRFTRIWIPWAAAFGLSAAAQAYFHRPWPTEPPVSEWLGHFWQNPLTWPNFLRQCGFLLHDPAYLLLPQDWSLGVELKGSALIPIFLLLVRRGTSLLSAFLGALLLGLPTGAYYVSFGFGVLIARYHPALLSMFRSCPSGWKWPFFAGGCALYQTRYVLGLFGELSASTDKVVWCLTSLGCASIIVSCLTVRRLQEILGHRWLTVLGRISFSVYLLQLVVLIVSTPPFVFALNRLGIRQPSVLLPLSILFSVSLTVLLSHFAYRWVEVPSIVLGHWVTARIQQFRERFSAKRRD